MKNLLTDVRILILALIASMGGLFSGCILGPSNAVSDEFARMASQEVANMSANSSGILTSGAQALSKQAATEADTVYYDWVVHPYSWDAAIQGYIRTATVTGSDGYERVRIDTLIFKDVSGAKLQYPTLATCKTIDHIRNVTHTKGGSELDIRVVMNSVISLTPDTTHVKNGTITGTYDGEKVGTGTITNVTRAYTNGKWQFPRSGNVSADFPRRSYNVDFTGNGNAKLTITNKVNDKTTIITIQVDER
jgi:hypothetical protein